MAFIHFFNAVVYSVHGCWVQIILHCIVTPLSNTKAKWSGNEVMINGDLVLLRQDEGIALGDPLHHFVSCNMGLQSSVLG